MKSLDYYYDEYLDIEASAEDILGQSLHPRGPHMLFDLVKKLTLPSGALVLDVGCGEGDFSLELARPFTYNVFGIDSIPRHMKIANDALKKASEHDSSLNNAVRFTLGKAEDIPVPDNGIDLIGVETSYRTSRIWIARPFPSFDACSIKTAK